jgi:hypothetical protein
MLLSKLDHHIVSIKKRNYRLVYVAQSQEEQET